MVLVFVLEACFYQAGFWGNWPVVLKWGVNMKTGKYVSYFFIICLLFVLCACDAGTNQVVNEVQSEEVVSVIPSESDSELSLTDNDEVAADSVEKESTEQVSEEQNSEPDSEEVVSEDASEDIPEYEVTKYAATLLASKTVNIRKGPSTDFDKVGVLEKGLSVEVTGQVEEGWYQIRYGEEYAYVSMNYLVDSETYQAQNEETSFPEDSETNSEESGSEEPSEQTDFILAQRERIVVLMNENRRSAGLNEFTQSDVLNQLAQVRANELCQVFAHIRPNGSDCFTILSENGVLYQTAGENIAMGYVDADDVMNGWMSSEGHKANMLNGAFAQVGIGIVPVEDQSGYYWVQIFTN